MSGLPRISAILTRMFLAALAAGLLVVDGAAYGAVVSDADVRQAAMAIWRGDFSQAGEYMAGSSSSGATGDSEILSEVWEDYTGLMEVCEAAREEAYNEYIDGMEESVGNARWRGSLLGASEADTWDSDAKTDMEESLRSEIDEDWLAALAQMTAAHNLADRMDLDDTIDAVLREEVVSRALAIGTEYEQSQQWLEAYGNVYYYLSALDNQSKEYDDHMNYLLRQATTSEMYVNDPNEDGVTWQERRANITRDIFYAGLSMVEHDFVETPDYGVMAELGLRNCQVLADTDRLAETFASLEDADLVAEYREGLAALNENVAELGDAYDKDDLTACFRDMLRLNGSTLDFPEEVVIAEFAEGAFSALDSYTYLIWPGEVADFRKDMTNEFSGVGIVINKMNGLLTVDSLLDDSPAMRAGLDAGDVIVAVDGESTATITLEMAVHRITGPRGTDVVLTIDREGFDEPRDYTITRDRIVVQTIKGLYRDENGEWEYFIDDDHTLGYVRITSFAAETSQRFRSVVDDLIDQGMQGLIVDLRDNAGGYLSSAVEIVDTFVSSGVIVSTRSARFPQFGNHDYARERGTLEDIPLVVLVNNTSASASEIVSGSLRDHDRALIVGTQTYGKGSVQQIQQFTAYEAELKITIAYYYLPSGRRVHRDPQDKANEDYGVLPHVNLELTAQQRVDSTQALREAGVLHLSGPAEGNWTVYTAEDLLASDPQLDLAALCLRAGVLAGSLGEDNVYVQRTENDAMPVQ